MIGRKCKRFAPFRVIDASVLLYLQETIIIEHKIVRKDEQIRLIMECRQSGLSDYQWCQRQGINAGTFYNWVSKLRKSGYTIPDSQSKNCGTAIVQDVVKVDLVSEDLSSLVIEQTTRPLSLNTEPTVAAELVTGNVTLRFFNGADQNLIQDFHLLERTHGAQRK